MTAMGAEPASAKRKVIKRILAGTDFSRPASNAVLRATMLAAEHAAKLEIVHVTPRIDRARLKRLGLGGSTAASSEALLRERLAEAADHARAQGVTVTVQLLKGSAPALLAREAGRSADLVVLGYGGERSLKKALIGTTAERVLERWTGDTLIVRNAPRRPYETLLACVALGPLSPSVVMSAMALSAQARLHILHAYQPPFEMKLLHHNVGAGAVPKHRAATKREAVRAMAELLDRCPVQGDRHVERHIRYGDPSTLIPGAAVRHGADVIVMGKNLSALEELFLGSVTKKVVRAARTDVLISDSR